WVPSSHVRKVVRAEFRTLYFVHGHNVAYKFDLCRHMFIGGTELRSQLAGTIHLRPMTDNSEAYAFPMFASDVPTRYLLAIRFV
ncbi:hypothetical protein X777_11333, partial [Ooceraea biroi]